MRARVTYKSGSLYTDNTSGKRTRGAMSWSRDQTRGYAHNQLCGDVSIKILQMGSRTYNSLTATLNRNDVGQFQG